MVHEKRLKSTEHYIYFLEIQRIHQSPQATNPDRDICVTLFNTEFPIRPQNSLFTITRITAPKGAVRGPAAPGDWRAGPWWGVKIADPTGLWNHSLTLTRPRDLGSEAHSGLRSVNSETNEDHGMQGWTWFSLE